MNNASKKTSILSFTAILQLAAPHTWPSSLLPVLLGAALSCAEGTPLSGWTLFCTLAAAVLLQSAVNTLNDYVDFISGLDSEENCPDTSDAALVYECSSPKAALALGLAFLLLAAVFGGILAARCGVGLLAYGAFGLAAILLYTLPGISFSALPLGELLSGGTMGCVLTCASFHAQAGHFSGSLLYLCLPAVIMIGCVMLVNNTADIEKDRKGGRKTLPVCIGRKNAQRLLRTAIVFSAVCGTVFVLFFFPGGEAALPVMPAALLISPWVRELFTAPVVQDRRPACMRGVLSAHVWINSVYTAAVVLSCLSH